MPTKELAKKGGATRAEMVEEVTQTFEPSETVKELLSRHNVSLAPPDEKTGTHTVRWEGRQFSLPAEPSPLGLRESAAILERKADEEEQEVTIDEVIDTLPWDGAQAFLKAVEDLFGWGIFQPQRVLWMKIPPVMKSIKTGPNATDTMQVFWGELYCPQVDATLRTSVGMFEGRVVFKVSGSIRKKDRYKIEQLLALARIYAYERSIYKAKAFRMFVKDDGKLDANREPEFIKIDHELEKDLIFSDDVKAQIETNLFAPIKYPQACRQLGIPLKRGVLLAGPYGVGKSMTAAVTAAMATKHGYTFIMLDRVAGLKSVLDFAHRYAPVVVFAEDVDRVIAGTERTVSIDDVLNTLDGVQGKKHEIITVLTTNHPEKISPAMLRPGRLDAIVTVTAPDAKAAERLMRLYGRGLIKAGASLENAGRAVAGQIPAVIREVVERAKLSAVARVGGIPEDLADDDLVTAAKTMEGHLSLMKGPKEAERTPTERLGDALADVIAGQSTLQDTAIVKELAWQEGALKVMADRFNVSLPTKD